MSFMSYSSQWRSSGKIKKVTWCTYDIYVEIPPIYYSHGTFDSKRNTFINGIEGNKHNSTVWITVVAYNVQMNDRRREIFYGELWDEWTEFMEK